MQCLKNLSIECTEKHYINEVYNRDNDMCQQMDMFYHQICPLVYIGVYYGTFSIAIFAGNEASMNNLGEQMDIDIKEAADYEVPDPPMMRMKENEAYGTFPN